MGVTGNRQYRHFAWGEQQLRALALVATGYSFEDEDARRESSRFLYINGEPGNGKSAVLLECAIRACSHIGVLIVCPTRRLVTAFKSKLPEKAGIESISIDTIQGVKL